MLRPIIDRALPLAESEVKLSPEARHALYRGGYGAFQSEVEIIVTDTDKTNTETYAVSVMRRSSSDTPLGQVTFSRSLPISVDTKIEIDQNESSILNRIERVESLTTQIRFLGSVAIGSASVAIAYLYNR